VRVRCPAEGHVPAAARRDPPRPSDPPRPDPRKTTFSPSRRSGGRVGNVKNDRDIREQTTERLEQAMGSLGTAATASMEERLPWFRAMSAEYRSWVGLVAQAGIAGFVEWFKHEEKIRPAIAGEVFGTAPRELMRAVRL